MSGEAVRAKHPLNPVQQQFIVRLLIDNRAMLRHFEAEGSKQGDVFDHLTRMERVITDLLDLVSPRPKDGAQSGEGSGWRTIDSAPAVPVGNRQIWTWNRRWAKPSLKLPDGDWWRFEAKQGNTSIPTHWMPFHEPAPPPASEGSQPEAGMAVWWAVLHKGGGWALDFFASHPSAEERRQQAAVPNDFEIVRLSPAPSPAPMAGGETLRFCQFCGEPTGTPCDEAQCGPFIDADALRKHLLAVNDDLTEELATALRRQDEAVKEAKALQARWRKEANVLTVTSPIVSTTLLTCAADLSTIAAGIRSHKATGTATGGAG